MSDLKIWKNTSVLNEYNNGLNFTDNKNCANIILLGSRDIDLNEFPNLKAIFRAGVGRDNVPIIECDRRGIVVDYPSNETCLYLFEETANYTVSLALRMTYPTPKISLPWNKMNRISLKEKMALIIGTGNIGSRVEAKLKTMMKVSSFDIVSNEPSELKDLVKKADIISLHIPSTLENNNFFDEEELSWMKSGSILINTARANLVNEDSLYQELAKGRISAAFDVFWEEPYMGKLKEFYPESFFMSPHIASTSIEFFMGCREDLDRMLKRINN